MRTMMILMSMPALALAAGIRIEIGGDDGVTIELGGERDGDRRMTDEELDPYLEERHPGYRGNREEGEGLREELDHCTGQGETPAHHCCCIDATADFIACLNRIRERLNDEGVLALSRWDRLTFMEENGRNMDFAYRPTVIGADPPTRCPREICPTYRVKLGGLHVQDHCLNDILYAYTAAMLGYEEEQIRFIGNLVNWSQNGESDPEDSLDAYSVGYLLVEATEGGEITPAALETALAGRGDALVSEPCESHCDLPSTEARPIRDWSQRRWTIPGR